MPKKPETIVLTSDDLGTHNLDDRVKVPTRPIRTRKDAAHNMHADFWSLACNLADECCEKEDGEECFNLHVFIDRLEYRIDSLISDASGWNGELNRFDLDAGAIARYLWACLAIKHEGNAYPSTYRGRPVLD